MLRLFLCMILANTTILFYSTEGVAQCCSAGNPVGGDLIQSGIGKQNLRVSAQYRHSFSDQYYSADHAEDVPQINFSRFNFVSVQMMYGITSKFNVIAEAGYFMDKSQSVAIQGNHLLTTRGLGDLALAGKYMFYTSPNKTKEFNLTAGVKLPVGAFDQEMDGVVLPLSLQPSNGAVKFTASVYYQMRPVGKKWGFFLISSLESSTTIQSRNFYYHYGNVYLNSLSISYKAGKNTSLVLQNRLECRGKDKREQNLEVASTGSVVLFLSPVLRYHLLQNWEMTLQADFPVYKYVKGSQLTNKYSFSVGISRQISLKQKQKDVSANILKSNNHL